MAHNKTELTGVERTFTDNEFIVSITDSKGIITYVNKTFLSISGYQEKELIGQQHNIIRHPDMPRCVFKYLWDTIATGEEVLAYVINKSKNGDHYWVLAHVTPTYKDGKIIGYLSSRRNTTKPALDVIKPLYKTLCAEEAKFSSKKDGMQAGLDLLIKILEEKNVSYSELIFKL